jgi:hypothetical protein
MCTAENDILFMIRFCGVVKYGLNILDLFKNPYDLPQPVIPTYPVDQIFSIIFVVSAENFVNVLEGTWSWPVSGIIRAWSN